MKSRSGRVEGGHGGGDGLLLDDLFLHERKADRYLRAADQRAGAWSILTGIAANRSIESGQAVQIQGLVAGLSRPDYTPMPSEENPETGFMVSRPLC
jgi:hypothetical protein